MVKIKILGAGCSKCKKLAEQTELAAKEMGIEYSLEKITDIREIINSGVMTTPALVVDGKVMAAGRLPSIEEIKKMLLSKQGQK
jgi:small redox-active disulfide protein 2